MFSNIESNPIICNFKYIHSEFIPRNIWYFSRIYRKQLTFCYTAIPVVSILFSRKYDIYCPQCKTNTNCEVTHLLLFCPVTERIREELWNTLLSILGESNFLMLTSMSPQEQILQLLNGCLCFKLSDESRVVCFKQCTRYIHNLAKSSLHSWLISVNILIYIYCICW